MFRVFLFLLFVFFFVCLFVFVCFIPICSNLLLQIFRYANLSMYEGHHISPMVMLFEKGYLQMLLRKNGDIGQIQNRWLFESN